MSFMNFSLNVRSHVFRFVLLALVSSVIVVPSHGQDLPPAVQHLQLVPAGTYVIPMDNVLQGNAGGTTFNLKAYGLANQLLQNGIPLLWVINYNKAKDGIDFTAAASRIEPSAQASASRDFKGGPFLIHPSYLAQALPIITAYGNSVAVYQLTNDTSVDVRYTLTHKPKIAIGLANGAYSQIHRDVFNAAGISQYQDYDDTLVTKDSCFTLIAQPHVGGSGSVTNVAGYKTFAQSGGNVVFQCRAIETYENDAAGRFQTTLGWNLDNRTDTALTYPNAFMPLSQFVGALMGNVSGYETDYTLSSGALQNGEFANVYNTNHTSSYIASTSKVYSGGPGGMVFELGGHDYSDGTSGAARTYTSLGSINGARMLLNALFVPPTRPAACGIDIGFPLVEGYKSVRLTNNVAPFNLGQGDTLTWTIVYINRGSATATGITINDVLPAGITLPSAGAQTVTLAGGATATKNNAYTGANPNQALLTAGTIPVNGKITISVPTVINNGFIGTLLNQPNATGVGMPVAGVNSDNIDGTSVVLFAGGDVQPTADSLPQTQTANIDPTKVQIFSTTAARVTVSGHILAPDGHAIRNASVVVTDRNGLTRTVRTNAFGYFTFEDIGVGESYVVSASARGYSFSPKVLAINDTLTDLEIVGEQN